MQLSMWTRIGRRESAMDIKVKGLELVLEQLSYEKLNILCVNMGIGLDERY